MQGSEHGTQNYLVLDMNKFVSNSMNITLAVLTDPFWMRTGTFKPASRYYSVRANLQAQIQLALFDSAKVKVKDSVLVFIICTLNMNIASFNKAVYEKMTKPCSISMRKTILGWTSCFQAVDDLLRGHWDGTGFKLIKSPYDETNKMTLRPAKTQTRLSICPVWSESSFSAWRKLGLLATHCAHSEDSDQTGRMLRLIWVFSGRTGRIVGFVMLGAIVTFILSTAGTLLSVL